MTSPKHFALEFSFVRVESEFLFLLFAVKFTVTEPDWEGASVRETLEDNC